MSNAAVAERPQAQSQVHTPTPPRGASHLGACGLARRGEDSLAIDAEVTEMFGALCDPRDAEDIAMYGVQGSARWQVARDLAILRESEARLDELKLIYRHAKRS